MAWKYRDIKVMSGLLTCHKNQQGAAFSTGLGVALFYVIML